MTKRHLFLFGTFQLTVDGIVVQAPLLAKSRAVLAYLAIENQQAHRREALAAMLWPDQPEDQARNSLRQVLYQLQRTIPGPSWLQVNAQTVQFDLDADWQLDTSQFTALLQASRSHSHRRAEACRACAARWQQAVDLYRGDFLAEIGLRGGVTFEEWALIRREQFRREVLTALRLLTRYYARRGEYSGMEATAQQYLALDPFDETALRQLMQALAWQGRRNTALAHYHAGQQLLAVELGVDLETETVELADQIRAKALLPIQKPAQINWPLQLTNIIGRDSELALLTGWLQTPHRRLITVVGPGGVGKTRLALEAAAQETFTFRDGVCFVSLAGLTDLTFVPAAIAQALDLPLKGTAQLETRLLEALHGLELLLILDNFEQLMPTTAIIKTLLGAAPQLTLLITSREALRLYGEHEFPLLPLTLPDPTRLTLSDELTQSPAIALFSSRASAIQPNFAITNDNAAAVVTICQRLDGLPLAIELAAARIRHFTPVELADRLVKRLPLLDHGPTDVPVRHQTLREAIAWSYHLLEPIEQRLFACLGVFVGGFSREAVPMIGNIVEPTNTNWSALIESLQEKSLLLMTASSAQEIRFSMLETIHEYAVEMLLAQPDGIAIQQAHAAYFLNLAEQSALYRFDTHPEAVRRLNRELDNFRAVLRWGLTEAGDSHLALRLTVTLGEFWYQQGLYQEGAHWLELALAQSDIPDQLCAQLLTYLGMIRRASGDYLSATDYFQKSLQIFQHLEEEAQMARVLEEMTDVVLLQADYEQADQLATQSLTLYRQVGNQQAALSIMLRLAAAAVEQRQAERAKPLLAQCLAMSHELNLPGSLATVLNVFGMFELEQGQAHESLPRFEESLHIFQKLDHRLNIAWTLRNLGLANLFCGQIKAAISYFQQGLALYQELDCEDGAATILEGIAGVALVMNHPNCAARLFGASAAIRATVGMPITPNSQAIYERMLAAGPATMGSAAWAKILDQGRSLSFAQAVAEALALFQTPEDG